MQKRFTIVIVLVLLFLVFIMPAQAQQRSYDYMMSLGHKSLSGGFYDEAIHYFTVASIIKPHSQDAIYYLNLTKRIKEGRIAYLKDLPQSPVKIEAAQTVTETVESQAKDNLEAEVKDLFAVISARKEKRAGEVKDGSYLNEVDVKQRKAVGPESRQPETLPVASSAVSKAKPEAGGLPSPEPAVDSGKVKQALDKYEQSLSGKQQEKLPSFEPRPQIKSEADTEQLPVTPESKKTALAATMDSEQKKEVEYSEKEIVLDDIMWERQPNDTLEVEIRTKLTLIGNDIRRFLVITPGFIEVNRLDNNRIELITKKRGSTFLHIWDQRGRWTFKVKVVLPSTPDYVQQELRQRTEKKAEPFRFSYSADADYYYKGDSASSLSRQSNTLHQWMGLYGSTPYGQLDGSVNFYKLGGTTMKATGYTVGLTNGKIGNFENFNIRGFDFVKRFSTLSLPGRGLRGILFESRAFRDRLSYSLLWGRDKATAGYLAPGVYGERESYLEGFKVSYYDERDNRYSFNYAHGYGEARDDSLSDRVFSLELDRNLGQKRSFSSELAYDEQNFAALASYHYQGDNFDFNLDLRDIAKDFNTITGSPGNRGEIGAKFSLINNFANNTTLSSMLDVYQDKFLAQNPNRLNYYFSTTLQKPLSEYSNWRSSLYYDYTPGSIAPYTSIHFNNLYHRSFKFFNGLMGSFSLGNNFQYSRYDFSGYDRVGISSGIRLPLSRSLSYDLNFRQNWVKNVASGDKNRPYVFTTGLNYYKNISKQLTLNLDLSYRDEENTAGKYSFLGGEDNVEFSAGIDYMPVEDVTLFLDTRLRNVWAEEADRDAYHELDVRWGLRSSWDLPFSWSPQAQVDGFIFNDLDGDGIKDESEEGIEGAKIRVGKKEVISQQDGRYQGKFSAERIIISVKPDSLPSGYVFTTPMSRQIKVKHNEVYRINFGFNTQSSIYGVVYDDKNNNQKPDVEDEFISGVNVNLDNGKEVVRTDFEGAYYFRDIEPGEHLITVDINSLPSGYLPGVKVKKKAVLSEGATYIYHIPLKREPQ